MRRNSETGTRSPIPLPAALFICLCSRPSHTSCPRALHPPSFPSVCFPPSLLFFFSISLYFLPRAPPSLFPPAPSYIPRGVQVFPSSLMSALALIYRAVSLLSFSLSRPSSMNLEVRKVCRARFCVFPAASEREQTFLAPDRFDHGTAYARRRRRAFLRDERIAFAGAAAAAAAVVVCCASASFLYV